MIAKSLFAAAAAVAVAGATLAAAEAAPVTLNLSYSSVFATDVTATGTATFDDSLLAAGQDTGFQFPPDDLDGFSLDVFDTGGLITSFGLGDLTGWRLALGGTGGVGDILDLNFFMDGGGVNVDGLSIEGTSESTLDLCRGEADVEGCGPDSAIDRLSIDHVSIASAVPEPATLALFGLGLLGLGALRRRNAA